MYSGTWKELSVVFGNKNVRILNRIYQLQDITCWRLFDNKNQRVLQERMAALSREETKHPIPRHIPTCVLLWANFLPFIFSLLWQSILLLPWTADWSDSYQNCVPGWNSQGLNHADRFLNLKICSFKWSCQVAESSRPALKSGWEPGSEPPSLKIWSLYCTCQDSNTLSKNGVGFTEGKAMCVFKTTFLSFLLNTGALCLVQQWRHIPVFEQLGSPGGTQVSLARTSWAWTDSRLHKKIT